MPFSGSRIRNPLSSRYQGAAQGNAAHPHQAVDPIRSRGGARCRHEKHRLCHRANKRTIEDHFGITDELEDQIRGTSKESILDGIRKLIGQCTFSYTRQTNMRGLGDAILTGETLIGDNPLA